MLTSRISSRTIAMGSLDNLQASQARSAKLQQQLSSGNALSKPSDNPVATNDALRYRTEIGVNEQYQRNNADGQAWLVTQDTALQDSVQVMQRVRSLVVQAGNTGVNDAVSRRALGLEIESLKENLLSSANTEYLGRAVFAGTKAVDAAFDAAGAYQGDGGAVTRSVAAGVEVQVNVTGAAAYGDTFAVLDQLAARLKGDTSVTKEESAFLDDVDAALKRLTDSLATVGARTNQLTALEETSATRLDQLNETLNSAEKIDIAKTLVEFNLQQTAYQSALSATARVIQPTLLDFLR
ncbi:flagellar hook-associated protein FlgL [Kineococcus arenarius]|uniref:flagellar hook-associated protein FlgL n=1 Tax=unclassified Kineococcus TaxID=2621656 RepID=UPI003D7D613C